MTRRLRFPLLTITLLACGAAQTRPSGSGQNASISGTPAASKPVVNLAQTCAQSTTGPESAKLCADLDDAAKIDEPTFAKRYAVPFAASLPFDPASASGFDLVTAKANASPASEADKTKLGKMSAAGLGVYALSAPERDVFVKNGFVITNRNHVTTFTSGYSTLYAQHLPLYVTADSILHAVHRSYDAILATLEVDFAIPELQSLLGEMRSTLAQTQARQEQQQQGAVRADVDLHLAVALSLLEGRDVPPVAGADPNMVTMLVAGAMKAEGTAQIALFGSEREEDFSQFRPRGHYTHHAMLEKYFRAMMWLGRVDYRIIETTPTGEQRFSRRSFDAAMLSRSLINGEAQARYDRIDRMLTAFVGEVDSMTLRGVDALARKLGGHEQIKQLGDTAIKDAILRTNLGDQRIASVIIRTPPHEGTLPLNRSFSIFGQRYVADSHVLSNVVYDRVPARPNTRKRLMPDPRDVAFAALRNDHAGALLGPSLTQFGYAPELTQMRTLLDAHGDDYWGSNLYTHWLSALRTLSPPKDIQGEVSSRGLPAIAATEPWARRIMNTQLASWAELRHDTILYAKQSYTVGILCEFPDAYVDPYPAFYAEIDRLALRGKKLATELTLAAGGQLIRDYFERLHEAMTILGGMADKERRHVPFTKAELAFINEAVAMKSVGCGSIEADGWYTRLFFNRGDVVKLDPTIADVHTQPTDEGGTTVGRVLHVATGRARLMTVAVDTCNGPRVYTGVVSSYFEKVSGNFDRWTDERWAAEIHGAMPPDVPWMKDLVVR